MPRLVHQGNNASGQEITLKPGPNLIGRNPGNDHALSDPSISSSHCVIEVVDGVIHVNDLGSTNGTFVDNLKVAADTVVRPGQTLRLGSVEMVVEAETGEPGSGGESLLTLSRTETEVPALPPMSVPVSGMVRKATSCSRHPAITATLICKNCQGLFCGGCVKTYHAGNRPHNICPDCEGFCVSLAEHRRYVSTEGATFFSLAPRAFGYPLKRDGLIMLFAGTLFFGFLDFTSAWAGLLALWVAIMSAGYLFAFMQKVIVSTTQAAEALPPWPDFTNFYDDMLVPCLHYFGTVAVCVGPGVLLMLGVAEQPWIGIGVILLGLFCLPMALLTVSLADSFSGLNPLLIFSGISKVPGPYLATCGLFLLVLLLVSGLEYLLDVVHIPILSSVLVKFVGLYGLTVNMRLLGLLYLTNRRKFGWFD